MRKLTSHEIQAFLHLHQALAELARLIPFAQRALAEASAGQFDNEEAYSRLLSEMNWIVDEQLERYEN